MILILGPRDIHTARLEGKLLALGEEALIFDTARWLSDPAVRMVISEGHEGYLCVDGRKVRLSDIRSVYWYAVGGYKVHDDLAPADRAYLQAEADSAVGSLLRNLDHCFWVNPPQAIELHRHKWHQLTRLKQAGVRVPDTLVTNDISALRDFYGKHSGQVITKPFYQGIRVFRIAEEHLRDGVIEDLLRFPCLFQEYVEGVDLRIHGVGDTFFASEVHAVGDNYKTAPFEPVAVEIPSSLQADCHRVMAALDLVLTGIDLRQTASGEYVFLEANPSPQYLIFEDKNRYPISETLASLLSHPPDICKEM